MKILLKVRLKMINIEMLRNFRGKAMNIEETEIILQNFKELKLTRTPFYLTLSEFDEILKWKLRSQYGRQKEFRSENSEEIVRLVTQAAFAAKHKNEDYELELKINLLCSLRGVGIPVASAILTLPFPEDYCVIDFRNWRQIFNNEQRSFSLNDYKRYIKQIRTLSNELGWTVQETDQAIWEYDRRFGKDFIRD